MRKLAAMSTAKSAMMPPAEYQKTSLLRFILLPGPLIADDHARREEREADHGGEIDDVARVEHAALEAFEMGHHRERGDDLHDHRARDPRQEIGHGRVTGEDEEQADQHRQDEADHLVTG